MVKLINMQQVYEELEIVNHREEALIIKKERKAYVQKYR
jgi:hypothetical protein